MLFVTCCLACFVCRCLFAGDCLADYALSFCFAWRFVVCGVALWFVVNCLFVVWFV